MTIAEQIKSFHAQVKENGESSVQDYDALVNECEEKAVSIDQDFDNGSTTYIFEDGSVLEWVGSELYTYDSKD